MLSQEADTIDGFTFVWFTDGIGWKSARGNLRETFEVMDTIYSIEQSRRGQDLLCHAPCGGLHQPKALTRYGDT